MNWTLGLNFYSSKVILFNPRDLETEASTKALIESDKYHIYLICKRKKLFFESTVAKDENTYLSTFYILDDKHNKVPLRVQHSSETKINSFADGYYNVDLKDHPNISVRDFILTNNFYYLEKDLLGTSITHPLPSDLEVMYVGQAFGRTAPKKIDYRISNHDKLQKIALQVLDEASNEEVLIVGLKIELSDLGTSLITDVSKVVPPTLESMIELRDRAAQRIPEGQEITIFEASLIKHFQPHYNKEYKVTFPSPDYPSYEEIYNTKFDYTYMTIDTKPVAVRLYSEHIQERKYIHSQHFPLTTMSDKLSLFEYLMELPHD